MCEFLDWNKLPDNLAYLAAPAEKYGRYQFDDRIIAFLRGISDDDTRELVAIQGRFKADSDQINVWLDQYPMTKHPEARLVYFFWHLIATGIDDGLLPTRLDE